MATAFEQIEVVKENVQPVKGGRATARIAFGLATSAANARDNEKQLVKRTQMVLAHVIQYSTPSPV